MSADPPDLDDRTFDEIREELLRRIPRYAPEWTDWNDSDPGVTLIELFAWLTETIGYRLNRTPERSLLTFLDVLGIAPEAAAPATADLTFIVRDGETRPILVPAGARVDSSASTDDGPVVFETGEAVELIPLRLRSLQVAGPSGFHVIASDEAAYGEFRPFGFTPARGNALYLGFGPAEGPVGFPEQIALLVDPKPGRDTPATGVRTQWEFRSSAVDPRWTPLALYDDGSRGFTRRGYLRIDGPPASAAVAGIGHEERPMHWIRCRLDAGNYPAGMEPVVELIRYNTVPAQSLTTVTAERAGISDGSTSQVIRLRNRPVLPDPGSVTVDVVPANADGPGPDTLWTVVRSLATSGRQDRHLELDAARGELRFGDGRTGQVPIAGFEVLVSYRYGGTALANVPASGITGLQTAPPGVESVTNLRAATGGRDEETADDLRRNAGSRLRTRERAVTAADYRELARKVGGVADAVAIGQRHPDYPGTPIPGCVLVAVLVRADDRPPVASPELLDAVRAALDPVRPIGTELNVRGARFVEVTVTVVVEADPYAATGAVKAEILERINRALTPDGANFGRPFFPTSLFGVIQQTAGVVGVRSLQVDIPGRSGLDLSAAVEIDPDQLVAPGREHDVTIRPGGAR
uniref:putative baseplate assembly protein n=1 Tax=Paractinoplanes polyasparticus TaxID=2856853 RepID=UPI001C85AE9D|nr:putative baseplate assembly protein [Actinoplanes polyasparticus]